jgi:hypothetical protein
MRIALAAAASLFPCASFAADLDVGVMMLSGGAPPADRSLATQSIIDTLGALSGIRVVSLAQIGAVLGPAVAEALAVCADDPCVVRTTKTIAMGAVVLGELEDEGTGRVLRIRAIETSSAARTIARVARTVAEPLAQAASLAAVELFPEQASASVGTLEIAGALPGARIVVDGRMSATMPLSSTNPDAPAILKLPPGSHEIRLSAPGHHPLIERAEVRVGQRTRLEVDLDKNRSNGPFILGGIGLAAGAAGGILGAVVASRAAGWRDACPVGEPCAPGFTRERYESDDRSIAQQRTVANALYGVAGAAVIGAVIWFFVDPGSDPVEP